MGSENKTQILCKDNKFSRLLSHTPALLLFLSFGDCNIVTTFPLPFLPSKPSLIAFPSLLQIHGIFSTNYVCMYIPNYSPFSLYDVICVFSEWPSGTEQPARVLFPREGHLSHSQLPLVAYSSSCRVEAWAFPCPCPWGYPCLAHIWAVMLRRLYVYRF